MSLGYNVYFAHPHKEKDSEVKKDMVKYLEYYEHRVIDPFEKEEERTKDGVKIWNKNRELIRECEEFFAWIPDRSVFGILPELEYASSLNKFITIVTDLEHPYLEWLEEVKVIVSIFSEEEFIHMLKINKHLKPKNF